MSRGGQRALNQSMLKQYTVVGTVVGVSRLNTEQQTCPTRIGLVARSHHEAAHFTHLPAVIIDNGMSHTLIQLSSAAWPER